MGAYAEKTYNANLQVAASVKNGPQQYTFNVKPENSIIQQSYELKNFDKPVEISANGKGLSYGRVSWHFNMLQLADAQPFSCTKEVMQTRTLDALLKMCCKYVHKIRHSNCIH